jgi:hypothetical protein
MGVYTLSSTVFLPLDLPQDYCTFNLSSKSLINTDFSAIGGSRQHLLNPATKPFRNHWNSLTKPFLAKHSLHATGILCTAPGS